MADIRGCHNTSARVDARFGVIRVGLAGPSLWVIYVDFGRAPGFLEFRFRGFNSRSGIPI